MKHPDITVEYEENCHGDTVVVIKHKGKQVFIWYDNANVDYPEDLSWSRMISNVFEAGFDLGQAARKLE